MRIKQQKFKGKSLSFSELLGVKAFKAFNIKTNNYCSLHCIHCTNLCDYPIHPESIYLRRQAKWEINIEDLYLWSIRLRGMGLNDRHLLTGGEVSLLPIPKIEQIINLLYLSGRRIGIETNGEKVYLFPQDIIHKLDFIWISHHGVNRESLIKTKNYLKSINFIGECKIIPAFFHYDIVEASHSHLNKGKKCKMWLTMPALMKHVIYPCTNLYWIEAMHNDDIVTKSLEKAGWTIYNSQLIRTMQHWRETLPLIVHEICENYCWCPNIKAGTRRRISDYH